jgi:hypothetical protein
VVFAGAAVALHVAEIIVSIYGRLLPLVLLGLRQVFLRGMVS